MTDVRQYEPSKMKMKKLTIDDLLRLMNCVEEAIEARHICFEFTTQNGKTFDMGWRTLLLESMLMGEVALREAMDLIEMKTMMMKMGSEE